ncbi:MAG: FmdB family zinc ribbon protein [Bacillota bacterium]
MPIYEYKCNNCNNTFEKLILSGQGEDLTCPNCGGKELKKLISAPFLPSSVGKPANDDTAPGPCCGSSPEKEKCEPGSCCSGGCH